MAWNVKQTLYAVGAGAVVAAALVGGVAMAQSPGESTSPPSQSPAPTAPDTSDSPAPGTPDAGTQPGRPRQRGGEDCPDKGGSGTEASPSTRGTSGSRGSSPSAAPQF